MRRQWLRQLISCTSKIYEIEKLFKLYEDSRKYPRIQSETIGMCMIFGYIFRMPSLERLEYWIHYGVFKRLAKGKQMPTVDPIRESLKGANQEKIVQMNDQVVQKARRNKVLQGGTIDGWIVSAIDGVELFESLKKQSKEALTRVKEGVTHYYYRFVGCMTIGKDPRIVLGMEPLKVREGDSHRKDEGEITAAKRLVERLHKSFHHFTDILVADALYANAPFINLVKGFGIDLVIRMKDKRKLIVQDALGLFAKRKPNHVWTTRIKNQSIRIEGWAETMEMTGVKGSIQFVRFREHVQTKLRGKVINEEIKEVWIVTTGPGEVGLETLWKIIHKRWDIENCLFHQLKTHCHMDHRFVDGFNAICACIGLQIVAFNLWQLYLFRYLRKYNQKEYPQVVVAERMRIEAEWDPKISSLLTG